MRLTSRRIQKRKMPRSLQAHEAALQERMKRITAFMDSGLNLRNPYTLDLRGDLKFGQGVSIDTNVIIIGRVLLGGNVSVGANCILEDCRIQAGSIIREFTTVSGSTIAANCRIGPYARIRPDCYIGRDSQIGNFVEMKTTRTGERCRINHHSFIGDCKIGKNVTIGAGAITCNYDGAKANPSRIRDNAFIGSGVMLIAPITVQKNAFIGAGSTVVKNAPANSLTLRRAEQVTIKGWTLKKKKS